MSEVWKSRSERAVVVADDEDDVALAGGAVLAHEVGEVDARRRVGGNVPGRRLSPVAAVDETGGGVLVAVGLVLRQGSRRLDGVDLAGAVAAVVAEAVDVEAVGASAGVSTLKPTVCALVDADVRREAEDATALAALICQIAGSVPGRAFSATIAFAACAAGAIASVAAIAAPRRVAHAARRRDLGRGSMSQVRKSWAVFRPRHYSNGWVRGGMG